MVAMFKDFSLNKIYQILLIILAFLMSLMFLVLTLSDSYLLEYFTALMFKFFSSYLYKDFEKN